MTSDHSTNRVENDSTAAAGREMTRAELTALGGEMMEAGIGVFPIGLSEAATKTQKRPLCRNGHNGATTDPEEFERMLDEAFERWVGHDLKTGDEIPGEEVGVGGHLSGAGLVMLDYDTKNGGRGDQVLEEHIARYGEVFEAVSFTSMSGATNVLLSKPEGRTISNHSPWSDVDIRSDNGWFVPPGVFCSWGGWEWRSGDWNDLDATEIPGEVLELLREASELASRPASTDEIDRWLGANHLTAMANEVHESTLKNYEHDIRHAPGGRNPLMKDALDWVKRQNHTIDRRAAVNRIADAWKARMAADGEPQRSNDVYDALGRVVGYDNAWHEKRAAEALAEAAPPDVAAELSEGLTPLEVLESRLISTGGLASIPMPESLVDGYLFRDSLAWIIGASGVGKSFVAVDLAMKVGTGGGYWHGRIVKPGRVLYIVAEGASGMHLRTKAWMEFYGVTDEPSVDWLPMAVSVFDPTWSLALATLSKGYDMIIVDTLARSTLGAEENSAKDAGMIINNLEAIRQTSGGACVVLVHHTGKDSTAGGRGSTAFKGALESEIQVTGSISELLKVSSTKQKNVEEPPPIHFRTEKVSLGGIGFDGEELTSVVIVQASAEELESAQSVGDDDSVSNVARRQWTSIKLVLLRHPNGISTNALLQALRDDGVGIRQQALREHLEFRAIDQGDRPAEVRSFKGDRGAQIWAPITT